MGPGRLAIEVVGGSALRAVIEAECVPLIGVEIERGVLVLLVAVPVPAPDHVVPSGRRWADIGHYLQNIGLEPAGDREQSGPMFITQKASHPEPGLSRASK